MLLRCTYLFVVSCQLFAEVQTVQIVDGQVQLAETLSRHVNFQDFSTAFMVLFRCITGEAWNGIMYELMVEPGESNCTVNPTWEQTSAIRAQTGFSHAAIGCSPGSAITRVFFLSYVVFASFVFLNLFVAVIIEGFENQDDEDQNTLAPEHLKSFCETWMKVCSIYLRLHTTNVVD